MPLEQANYIHELVESNPVGSTDLVSEGDDHLRLIKKAVKASFPQVKGAVAASHTELSHLKDTTGVTGTGKLVLSDSPTVADLKVTGSMTLPEGSVSDAALSNHVALTNRPNTFAAQQRIASTFRILQMLNTNAPPDSGFYEVTISESGTLLVRTRADNAQGGETIIEITRTGAAVDIFRLHTDVSVSGTLSGNGAGLTGLNASSLAGGTVDGARLGGNQTMSGNKTFSDNVTIGGVARKDSGGGFAYHASANNLGGRITISSSEATTAAQVGDPGDMRFVYL